MLACTSASLAILKQVWPPEGGKDVYLRGALAKKLLSDSYDPADVSDESREYVMAMSAAGERPRDAGDAG